jgi:peroxiredoxin
MKRILAIVLLMLGLGSAAAQESTTHASVTSYLQTLLTEPVDSINVAVDRLIDSVGRQQPELQSKVAGIAFDYFSTSPVMGHEAVAVHIADDWFLNQRLKMENESLYPLLYTFAEFNRSSLVGKDAPSLQMQRIDSLPVEIRDIATPLKVLFFYDTDCSTCRKETPLLAELARNYHGEALTLFAIYTQSDRSAWESYVQEWYGDIDNPDVQVIHLWDPEAETGFHKKYGVLSTPMMFLLNEQNVIIGRGLDSEALAQMLGMENALVMQYKSLFDNIFGSFNPLTIEGVEYIADAFAERTRPDRKLYTEVMLNLFNYLRHSDNFAQQQGALYVAEKYIASEPDYWSPEFMERTVYALAQARLNPAGSKATQLYLQKKCGKTVPMYNNKHFYTLVFFHLLDCQQCQKELAELKRMNPVLYDMDIHVVLVYVGSEQEKWKKFVRKQQPSHWTFLNDFKNTSNMRMLYDLDYVPHLYLLDQNGLVVAKDIHASELQDLLKLL